MKRQIRYGVFETNSSSVHSLTIVDKNEYDKWKVDEIFYSKGREKFYTEEDIQKEYEEYKIKYPDETIEEFKEYREFITYDEYWNNLDYESFEEEHKTKNGDVIVAFGYYGHD